MKEILLTFDGGGSYGAWHLGVVKTLKEKNYSPKRVSASSVGVFAGIAIVFIPALGAYVQPSLLGGNKSMLIGSLINDQFGESRNWPVGSALAVLLLAMTGVILLATRRRKLEFV